MESFVFIATSSTKFLFLFPRFCVTDRIDFFFLGDFNEVEIQNVLESSTGFKGSRSGCERFQHCQHFIPISCKKAWFGKRNVGPVYFSDWVIIALQEYGDEEHLPMIVMNGFTQLDLLTLNFLEMYVKMLGLAYTISSQA